jgi:tetratricopeptide (TPR) repeat protein
VVAPIIWTTPRFTGAAPSSVAEKLLRTALAASPDNARLQERLGSVLAERFNFSAAEECFTRALNLAPRDIGVRLRLAACLLEEDRFAESLDLLRDVSGPGAEASSLHLHRALALLGLQRASEAEDELRAALLADPNGSRAFGALARLLRGQDRIDDLGRLCEALAAQGVGHARLLLERGRTFALTGDQPRARALLFDPARLGLAEARTPAPFDRFSAFAAAFADALIGHPLVLASFAKDQANRSSRRVHQLADGPASEPARALVRMLQSAIDDYIPSLQRLGDFDPWFDARPTRARLACWGLIQRAGEHEAWHLHPAGWLSGVIYLRLPEPFSTSGDGAGCIEFGPPPSLAERGCAPCEAMRIAPREGLLILAPSHYHHRTIPFTCEGARVSFAFDVVPAEAESEF